MTTFTLEDKCAAAKREVGFRKRVYARRVADDKMSQELADKQIGVMEAIAQDYEDALARKSPTLF